MRKVLICMAAAAMIGAVGCGDKGDESTNGTPNANVNNDANNTANNGTTNDNNTSGDNNTANNGTTGDNNTTGGNNTANNNTVNNTANNNTANNNTVNNTANNNTANTVNNTTGPSVMCTTFCDLVEANCAGEASPGYADRAACEADCATFADDGMVCTEAGGADDCSGAFGDNVQCRVYHAGAAAGAADPHCMHAGGDAPCSD